MALRAVASGAAGADRWRHEHRGDGAGDGGTVLGDSGCCGEHGGREIWADAGFRSWSGDLGEYTHILYIYINIYIYIYLYINQIIYTCING